MTERLVKHTPGRMRLTRLDLWRYLLLASVLLVLTISVALCFGPEIISPVTVFNSFFGDTSDSATSIILFSLRLPRIFLAVGVGATLATPGVLFQAMLRNPLAEPYMLGISNGCAVGAMIGYMLGLGPFGSPALSFVAGAIVVLAVLRIGRGAFGPRSEAMLLGGVMVAAITAAMIFLLLHFLGPQLRSAIQWMLGDLSSASASVGYSSIGLFLLVGLLSLISGDKLNAIALGDEEAASLGVNVSRMRTVAYLTGSFLIGLSVAFCGAIGFIGLVVPHILRRIVGPDHRALLPVSAFGGAIFLIVCDTLARSLMPAVDASASELPVGAVTALVGAPIFIYLLRRGRGE
jgi:iron complex transport system permease protein